MPEFSFIRGVLPDIILYHLLVGWPCLTPSLNNAVLLYKLSYHQHLALEFLQFANQKVKGQSIDQKLIILALNVESAYQDLNSFPLH